MNNFLRHMEGDTKRVESICFWEIRGLSMGEVGVYYFCCYYRCNNNVAMSY